MKLYRFELDFGRSGLLSGLFASADNITEYFGKEVYMGEVLGKHSEVCFDLEPDMIEEIKLPEEYIKKLVSAVGSMNISGYNPLSYIDDSYDEDDIGDD